MSTITITKTAEDSASKVFQISIPVERVRAAEERALAAYSRRVKLPGFRVGRAPAAIIKRRLGDALKQQVVEEVVREGWEEAQSSEGLKPVADPQVRNLKFEEGQPVEFELMVEVRPEIKLGRLGGFTITKKVAPVTDDMVTEQIDNLRESKAAWLPVEDQAPVEGNMVRVEVAAVEDGVAKPAQPYTIIIGQGQAVPTLEEEIMRLHPGQESEADIKFPDDYSDPARRGQTRRVRIKLLEVKRQELPPLDDGFARSLGDFDDLATLRAKVREDLEAAAEREAEAATREKLLEEIVAANNVEAPPSMVNRALHAYLHAYRVPHEKEEQFYNEFRPLAVSQVKRELTITAVASQQKLFATESDLDDRIHAIAEARGLAVKEVYSQLEQAKKLPELERSITEEKVIEFLLPQSKIEEASS